MPDPHSIPVVTLPPPYLEAVGALITNAAVMELLVDHVIAVLLRMKPSIARRILGKTLSVKIKLATMKAIHDDMAAAHPELLVKFHAIYQKLTSAQTNRSKIAHGKFGGEAEDGADTVSPKNQRFYIVWYPEDEEEAVTEPMPLPTLQGYANQMAQATRELESYLRSIRFEKSESGQHRWPPVHDKKIPAGRKEGAR